MPETALINNWLFASMAVADQDVLRPSLARREVEIGDVLFSAGDHVDVIHFPVSAQIANIMRLPSGESLAVSSVGREGVTGLAAFMALEPLGWGRRRSRSRGRLGGSGRRFEKSCRPQP